MAHTPHPLCACRVARLNSAGDTLITTSPAATHTRACCTYPLRDVYPHPVLPSALTLYAPPAPHT